MGVSGKVGRAASSLSCNQTSRPFTIVGVVLFFNDAQNTPKHPPIAQKPKIHNLLNILNILFFDPVSTAKYNHNYMINKENFKIPQSNRLLTRLNNQKSPKQAQNTKSPHPFSVKIEP